MRGMLAIMLAALAFPAAASAHATLQSTTPRFGHEVQRAPTLIRLHFDQRVKVLPGRDQGVERCRQELRRVVERRGH